VWAITKYHGANTAILLHIVGVYELIKSKGFVPYDTCQPYLACSSESTDGFCSEVDTTCTAANTCRTCGHFGDCTEIDVFPNATVAEYGSYSIFESDKTHKIMAEIYARGPVAAGKKRAFVCLCITYLNLFGTNRHLL
jgi:hypothetical protein